MTRKLRGRIALVTGASRRQGIGTAICKALAREGADIFFTHWSEYDRSRSWGVDEGWPEQLQTELREEGVRAEHVPADLSDPHAPVRILDAVQAKLGSSAAILVNNAGYWAQDGWDNLNAAILDKHYAVNIRGTCLLSTEFARRYNPIHGGGRIMSLISDGPQTKALAYVATKGALIAFTEPLAAALGPKGITVNTINPGPTDTGWIDAETKEALLKVSPMGRLGTPEDAAKLVVFLAGDDSGWITGQCLTSDGGFLGR